MAGQTYELFFGVGAGGGLPTWATYKNDDTGAAILPAPVFVDAGDGFYKFAIDWSTVGATHIRYVASLVGFADQWDLLTSNPAPGTVTPAARVENLAIYPTAKTVINRAAIQCGLIAAALDDPYASTDQGIALLRELLVSLADDLAQKYDWTNLIQPVSFVTDGVSPSYSLPPDFKGIVDQTFWNRSTRLPGVGPLSPQQVAALQARLVNIILNVTYQIAGGLLTFPIVPPSGATVTFDYLSSYWVQSSNVGAPDKSKPTSSTDILLFDEELLVAGVKYLYLDEKGFDTIKAEGRYLAKLEAAIGRATGAPILSLGNSSRNSMDRMVDGRNVPEGNWPQ